MPFTPLHVGPGMLLKSMLRGSFSLMIFGWTQIVMDVPVLWAIINGEGHLHGFSHTYVGALVFAAIALLTGWKLSEMCLRLLALSPLPRWLCGEHVISIKVAACSALAGSASHVWLDSLVHADVQPFFPWNLDNPFLGWIASGKVQWFCVYSGLVGLVLYVGIVWVVEKKRRSSK